MAEATVTVGFRSNAQICSSTASKSSMNTATASGAVLHAWSRNCSKCAEGLDTIEETMPLMNLIAALGCRRFSHSQMMGKQCLFAGS